MPSDQSLDPKNLVYTQSRITAEGDLALVITGGGALERHFPPIAAGELKIEMGVRAENPTAIINQPRDSVLKVYASDADQAGGWAFRWHYPYAWPEVGGNTFPRFFVIDGRGKKRKGLEYTDFRVQPERWYQVTAVLDLDRKTWEFSVDGVKFDAPGKLGHEMAWWQRPVKLSKLRLNSVYAGKNWIDAIQIWHNGKLLASTGFNGDDGYEEGQSVVGRPGKKDP